MSKKKYSEILNPKIKHDIFINLIDTIQIDISIVNIDKNIEKSFLQIIKNKIEGRCNKNGYVKKNSVKIVNYSCGSLDADKVLYIVTYSCDICNPVEGMNVECYVKNITKAGIRAELFEYQNTDTSSPIIVFIARDHNYDNSSFLELKHHDVIKVKIIGSRFVLNDEFISCIGEII